MSTDTFSNSILSSDEMITVIIRDQEEVCLHALEILQTDPASSYLPVYIGQDNSSLSIDTSECVHFSSLSFSERLYVERNFRKLFSEFLLSIMHSLDQGLSPGGIWYSGEHLYYHPKLHRIMCIYLPLKNHLQGRPVRLSEIHDDNMDDLLHVFFEKKWITQDLMAPVYRFFEKDDEEALRNYIRKDMWKEHSALPPPLKSALAAYVLLLILYILFSPYTEEYFSDNILALIPGLLFLTSTILLFSSLLLCIRTKKRNRDHLLSEKDKRRKDRNARMLFPSEKPVENLSSCMYEFAPDPVQFIETTGDEGRKKFTIWTKGFTIGLDTDCCDLTIDHSSVSLKHAFLGTDENGFFIEDLHSRHGSFVNRKRIEPEEKYYLSDGDLIGFGKKEYIMHFVHEKKEDQSPN